MSALAPPDRPPLLTTSQVAERFAVSERTVRRAASRNRLPAIRLAERGALRFRPEDVERILRGEAA